MIGNLKPYPARKDSGVSLLGEVPKQWELLQLGRIGRFTKGNGGTKDDDVPHGVPCVRYGDLYTKHKYFIRKSRACVSERKAVEYTPIQYGDVLFAGSGETIEEIGKSAVNLLPGLACCGGDVILFRPSIEVNANFLGYAADCPPAAYQKSCMGRGITIMHIYGDELKYMWIALPSIPEQATIVRFLDHADQRIRRYTHAKQKLIKLLKEQKQAIIRRAVTRGLDPNVRLKPSGVEWLGDVPEHWEVKRCRYLFREVDRRSADGSEEHLSMSQRLGLVPSHLVENRTLVSESYAGGKLCEVGDLVLNRLKAHLGVFALARFPGVISPDYTVLRPVEPEGAEYLETVLRSTACRHELRIRTKGIVEGFWRLYTDDFNDIRLPVPPLSERRAIIDRIRSVTSKILDVAQGAEREISLLREYRTRLIADVVTGNLDVREAAARLPDEAAEPEMLDEADALSEAQEAAADDFDAVPEEAEA